MKGCGKLEEAILEKIIKNYKTPAYIFDVKKINDRICYLKEKLPKRINLCYAIKANTFIVKEIENNIDRFEVCSPGEYFICKEKQINPQKILISGVYKTPEIIEKMVLEDGITNFTIESMEQFELLKEISKKSRIKALIRITSGNQFGINENEAENIIKSMKHENLEIVGIQYFSGTQKKSIKNLNRELEYIQNFIERLKDKYEYEANELEFGPGFPVHYFQNEEFDEEAFLEDFSNIINQMNYNGKIILELGRSIASCCGSYITKVVDKKTNKGENYAILDGGIHHLVYYGQSMAMKIPICKVYPAKKEKTEEKWNLCGSLCTINDILVKQFPVGNLQVGDVFVFENTGAYCVTEGISLFLSRDLPCVLKIKENNEIELVRENVPTYKLNSD